MNVEFTFNYLVLKLKLASFPKIKKISLWFTYPYEEN